MGESSKIWSFFEKNYGFHPHVSSMWKSIFKNESHVGRIFKILEKNIFIFPMVDPIQNLTILTYWRNKFFWNNFCSFSMCFTHTWDQSKYQKPTLYYIWGIWYQKMTFFFTDFFNFTNMYLLFRLKNTSKWSHLLWKRCQKNRQKMKKS